MDMGFLLCSGMKPFEPDANVTSLYGRFKNII